MHRFYKRIGISSQLLFQLNELLIEYFQEASIRRDSGPTLLNARLFALTFCSVRFILEKTSVFFGSQ